MGDSLFESPEVQVEVVKEGNRNGACIKFTGSWGKLTRKGNEAEKVIDLVKDQPYSRMLLDLNDLDNINSRFISLLVLLLESDKEVSLKSPSEFLSDLLEMVGLLGEFSTHERVEDFFQQAPDTPQ